MLEACRTRGKSRGPEGERLPEERARDLGDTFARAVAHERGLALAGTAMKKERQVAATRIAPMIVFGLLSASACAGAPPSDLGVSADRLSPCPPSPNCVSSDAADAAHRVEAFSLAVEPEVAWPAAREAVSNLPRTIVVEETATYLRAECASAVLGFVDDLELHLRPSDQQIAVRSASRLGYSDVGVNRRRVERLRERLQAGDVVR